MEVSAKIGIISDTHGLLRPEALDALQGSEHIIHAGDIGGSHILNALEKIAPVTAVRGNNDKEAWADSLPDTLSFSIAGAGIYLLHDAKEINFDLLKESGCKIVIAGHSHRPSIEEKDGILFINPGSAGPRRFKLPISVASLYMQEGKPSAHIHLLNLH